MHGRSKRTFAHWLQLGKRWTPAHQVAGQWQLAGVLLLEFFIFVFPQEKLIVILCFIRLWGLVVGSLPCVVEFCSFANPFDVFHASKKCVVSGPKLQMHTAFVFQLEKVKIFVRSAGDVSHFALSLKGAGEEIGNDLVLYSSHFCC